MDVTHRFKLYVTLAAVTISALVSFAGVRADVRSDASITFKAQSALDSANGSRVSSVHVSTTDGRVTLFGRVRSASDKADASARVWPIAGVVEVRNLLQIVTPGTKDPAVRRSDDVVIADIRRALQADRSLDDSSITVTSVDRGVVLLGGTAASSSDNVRALRTTADRPGVRRVFSDIDAAVPVPLPALSAVRLAPADPADEIIRRDVTKALNDLDARAVADVHVLVKDGVVWLTGTVPSWQGNASRLNAARSMPGVRSITNTLRVVAPDVAAR